MTRLPNAELVAMWPTVPHGRCAACNTRGQVTWAADRFMTFCAACWRCLYPNGGHQ